MRARSVALLLLGLALAGGAAHADDLAAGTQTIAKNQEPLKPVPDGGVYIGVGGGGSPDAGSGMLTGSLVLDRPLFWRLGAWITGEWGYVWRAPEDDFTLRITIGVRVDVWRSETKKYRLLTDVAFAHMHEASTTIWKNYPGETFLGESKFGLGHRSGVEAGAALLVTPWIDSHNWFLRRFRVLARISALYLPDDAGPNFFLSFITSVGVAL